MQFDLRLELEGVLKSWAVPKGPSLRAEEKRLAVHVEDHPIEYAIFEGVIPAGNYGAGSVIVWDRGAYGSFKPEDIRAQYARGKLELELFDLKYDGVRVIAERRGEEVRMLGRSGEDITARYPEIAAALCGLTAEHFMVDGEIVAYDASGRPSFGRLQKRMLLSRPHDIAAAMARVPVRAVFFDCLALEGHDLRKLRLLDRKECLARILPPAGVAQAGAHAEEPGGAFFAAASEMGLEGSIAKRGDSPYAGKR